MVLMQRTLYYIYIYIRRSYFLINCFIVPRFVVLASWPLAVYICIRKLFYLFCSIYFLFFCYIIIIITRRCRIYCFLLRVKYKRRIAIKRKKKIGKFNRFETV